MKKLSEVKKELKGKDIYKMQVVVADLSNEEWMSLEVETSGFGESFSIELSDEADVKYAAKLTAQLIKSYGEDMVKPYELGN